MQAATTAAGVVMSAFAGKRYLSGEMCREFDDKAVRGEWSEVALGGSIQGTRLAWMTITAGKSPSRRGCRELRSTS